MSTAFIVTPRVGPPAPLPALGSLAPYLADPSVTDVFVNGRGGLFVDHGSGARACPEWRASEREVRQLATALIAAGNRHVDDAHPCVDVRLPGGLRVHVVLAPISTAGTAISIRVARPGVSTFEDLVALGAADAHEALFLQEAVARRANFLVSGAAGVGKTTLLAALLALAPATERIVTIEDVAELVIDHPHHVALEARQPNLEGAGAVSLARLVREALRMKPDRLVIGECRGGEVRELLTALNTGHDGGAGTVHANSLADVATRLEALGALAGLDDAALARQVASAMEFVVHLERDRDGARRIAAIGDFRIEDGRLRVVQRAYAAAPGSRRAKRVSAGGGRRSAEQPSDAGSARAFGPDAETVEIGGIASGSVVGREPTDGVLDGVVADPGPTGRAIERPSTDADLTGRTVLDSAADWDVTVGTAARSSADEELSWRPSVESTDASSQRHVEHAVPYGAGGIPSWGQRLPVSAARPDDLSMQASVPAAAVTPAGLTPAPAAPAAPAARTSGLPPRSTVPNAPAAWPATSLSVHAQPTGVTSTTGATVRSPLLSRRPGFVPARRAPEVPRAAA